MANPKLKDIRSNARKRSAILRIAEGGLMEKASASQSRLNAYVLNELLPSLDIENGRVKSTTSNLRKASQLKGLKKFLRNVVNASMYDYYGNQFNNVSKGSKRYYGLFETPKAAEDRIKTKGEILTSGFLDSLFDKNEITQAIQSTIVNGVNTGQRTAELKNLLTEQIKGKEEKFGLIEAYHYKNGRDEFQAYSRTLDNEYSTVLDLNYAIYAGGEMNTTRTFCTERAGNVYNRETILSWNDENWQGKKENNNILIDLGGYNCRHDLDFISYALAKRINPGIEKSKFDK